MEKRTEQFINFLRILDKFKSIERRTMNSNMERHENDAEHTWHMCMFALLLHKEVELEVNLEHALKLILVHDLVEIYAGDTFAYDRSAKIDKKQREHAAANKLFKELPSDLETEFHELWIEYESNETNEASYAQAIDKMQAFAQNVHTNGEVWRKNKITPTDIKKHNESWVKQDKTYEHIFKHLWQTAEKEEMFYVEDGASKSGIKR